MNVLVVGSGGREHAFVDVLSKSRDIESLHAAPGNAGMADLATCHAVPVNDLAGLVALAQRLAVGLVVVGPEVPLVAGLVDKLEAVGIPALGPNKAAAQLEGSKAFMKDLCRRARIPTAGHRAFNDASEALAWCGNIEDWPCVIKADGLAAGKGVIIAQNEQEACDAVRAIMLDEQFGKAGERLLIEEFLKGEELSVIALVDGETVAVLEPSRDHKRAFDGDKGPNTGGMGAYSPTSLLTPRIYEQIEERVLIPTVHALAKQGKPFRGLLYAGLMLTGEGPMVLEFNVRGGDPEMEILLPRLKTDALQLFLATATGTLDQIEEIEWTSDACCGVVLTDGDYPLSTTPGAPITGIEQAEALPGVRVYHSGTKREVDGKLVTAGGRVLCVTALGSDLADAQRRVYEAVERIHFRGARFRRDIGTREIQRSASPPAPAAG
ncbi:MAG: phosphoribosylamine--glycine ligase [Planctomycetota bacterium]|nr:MAG: phosphoribosylamine--glycine ligase [Planctomycetota bacterium]